MKDIFEMNVNPYDLRNNTKLVPIHPKPRFMGFAYFFIIT